MLLKILILFVVETCWFMLFYVVDYLYKNQNKRWIWFEVKQCLCCRLALRSPNLARNPKNMLNSFLYVVESCWISLSIRAAKSKHLIHVTQQIMLKIWIYVTQPCWFNQKTMLNILIMLPNLVAIMLPNLVDAINKSFWTFWFMLLNILIYATQPCWFNQQIMLQSLIYVVDFVWKPAHVKVRNELANSVVLS